MGVDDGEGRRQEEGEVGVEADAVDVEERDLQRLGVRVYACEDGGIDRGDEQDEGEGGEGVVVGDERFKRLRES